MKTISRKELDRQVRAQADRVWASLVGELLLALKQVYEHPSDDRNVEGNYYLLKQRIVEANAKLSALRSLAIHLDLDIAYKTDVTIDQLTTLIHRFFELEIIREVLLYDFAAEVRRDFIAKLQEAA